MKEVDDTPVGESETEVTMTDIMDAREWIAEAMERIAALDKRIAHLEVKRTPADNNMDDPEWY
tara:strand:+ start:138 stop:326 length:189 start_codon:yes stop_codon:yes gene_type:complete